jgi:NADH-quinone oxidoreductase subunit C
MQLDDLTLALRKAFGEDADLTDCFGQLTLTLAASDFLASAYRLRDDAPFDFDTLLDVCGVDYLHHGASEWRTELATESGFSRAVDMEAQQSPSTWKGARFAVVYHLLSVQNNHRLRLRVFVPEDPLLVDSAFEVWPSANWYERETFDLYGIMFNNHPDLRRILTDYGFMGHPFRKDFPMIGEVEMRYDATEARCVYEPVSIKPRTLVPKVIRSDNRYLQAEGGDNGD